MAKSNHVNRVLCYFLLCLLKELRALAQISVVWIRGHSGDSGNILADKLANTGRSADDAPRNYVLEFTEDFVRSVFRFRGLSNFPVISGGSKRIHYRDKATIKFIYDDEDVFGKTMDCASQHQNGINMAQWAERSALCMRVRMRWIPHDCSVPGH